MLLSEAKAYVGKVCHIRWQDRAGNEQLSISKIHDATFVPLYGGYVVTDCDDIRLDRVLNIGTAEEVTATQPVSSSDTVTKVTA